MPLPQKKLIPGLFLALAIAAFAVPPLWWSAGNPPVINPAAAEENQGVANVGQAKHMAKSALETVRDVLPAVAAQIEADLTTGTNPILDFTIPNPKTPEWIKKQQSLLLIGQLKAIADPFYTRLNAVAPTWLAAQRTANGSNYAGSIFPWTSVTTDDENKALANIGQLKTVFSLHFTHDSDSDGMPDLWEIHRGLNANLASDAYSDTDVDGYNNLQEFILGTNPFTADTLADGDNDGIPNIYETAYGLNLSLDDSLEDLDGDRIPNIFEFRRGTRADDPASKPLATFVVNQATGNNSSTDNIYTTIEAAINQAKRTVYDSNWGQSRFPDRYAVIEVKAGTYPELVSLSTVPMLLLGELGATAGPVTITGNSSSDGAVIYVSQPSVIDGFIITHTLGRKGAGVELIFTNQISTRRRLVNCIIHGNDGSNGGGVRNLGCHLDLVHCTVTANKDDFTGRGIFTSGGKLNLINSIVWDNGGAASQEIHNHLASSQISVTTSMIANGEHGGINVNPTMNPHGWLKSTSPAIKRSGTALAAASRVDINGEARGNTPDIGADEFVSIDGDTLPDFWERLYFGNLTKSDNDDNDSPSGDRLSNYYEYHFGFDPLLPLTPGNQVSDLYEAVFLRKNDVIYPVEWKTDTDDDALTAGEELYYGSNPLVMDSNGDWIPDGMALTLGLSLTSNDTDGDGITNAMEVAAGTSQLATDSDGDGVADNLDSYPLDPERNSFTPGGAGDTTAPLITLLEPTGAVPIP